MKYIEYNHEELDILKAASVPITKQDMSNVLFGFANFNASDDFYGSYGGFSFFLYETGLIKVHEYLFDDILADEHRYCVPQVCVNEIMQYYSENKDTLLLLSAPDNGSCDGSFSEFFFGNDWISALNIEYHDEQAFTRALEIYQETQNYRTEFRVNVARKLERNPRLVNDNSFQIAMKIAQSFENNQDDFESTKK